MNMLTKEERAITRAQKSLEEKIKTAEEAAAQREQALVEAALKKGSPEESTAAGHLQTSKERTKPLPVQSRGSAPN